REDEARHEAEDGDALQDVEQRHEHALRHLVFRRPVAVGQREEEREGVGEEAAREGVEGVARKRGGGEIDLHLRVQRAPLAGERDEAEDDADQAEEKDEVEPSRADALEERGGFAPRRAVRLPIVHGRAAYTTRFSLALLNTVCDSLRRAMF